MKKLYLVFLIIFIIMVVTFYIISHDNKEEILKRDMKDYYEKYLKGKVIGVSTHQVSLEMLEKTNYDMKVYNGCDIKKSFSYIKLQDKKIVIENHLKCKK